MAVSPSGDYVVSSSHDKSLRLWERTREPLILEEEREMVRTQAWLQNVLVGGCLVLSSAATPPPVHVQAPPEEVSNTPINHFSSHTETEMPLGIAF